MRKLILASIFVIWILASIVSVGRAQEHWFFDQGLSKEHPKPSSKNVRLSTKNDETKSSKRSGESLCPVKNIENVAHPDSAEKCCISTPLSIATTDLPRPEKSKDQFPARASLLILSVEPQEARVFLDNIEHINHSTPLMLAPGKYTLKIEHKSCYPYLELIEISPKEKLVKTIRLVVDDGVSGKYYSRSSTGFYNASLLLFLQESGRYKARKRLRMESKMGCLSFESDDPLTICCEQRGYWKETNGVVTLEPKQVDYLAKGMTTRVLPGNELQYYEKTNSKWKKIKRGEAGYLPVPQFGKIQYIFVPWGNVKCLVERKKPSILAFCKFAIGNNQVTFQYSPFLVDTRNITELPKKNLPVLPESWSRKLVTSLMKKTKSY